MFVSQDGLTVYLLQPPHLVTSTAASTAFAAAIPFGDFDSNADSNLCIQDICRQRHFSYDPFGIVWCRACTMDLQDFWHLSRWDVIFAWGLLLFICFGLDWSLIVGTVLWALVFLRISLLSCLPMVSVEAQHWALKDVIILEPVWFCHFSLLPRTWSGHRVHPLYFLIGPKPLLCFQAAGFRSKITRFTVSSYPLDWIFSQIIS